MDLAVSSIDTPDSHSFMAPLQRNEKVKFQIMIDHAELQGLVFRKEDSILFELVESLDSQRRKGSSNGMVTVAQPPMASSPLHNNKRQGIRQKQEMIFNLVAAGRVKQKKSQVPEQIESHSNCRNQFEQTFPAKLTKAISLLVNVKGFYRQVTKNSRIYQKLSQIEHDSIGDVATDSLKFSLSKRSNSAAFSIIFLFLARFSDSLPSLPVFTPFNYFKRLWDLLALLIIMVVSFIFSLRVFFLLPSETFSPFLKSSLIFFIADIFIEANTGFLHQGFLIISRKKILFTYLTNRFLFDSIALIPLFGVQLKLEFSYQLLVIFHILFLLKGKQLSEIWDRFHYFLSYQRDMKNLSDLIQLIFLISSVCHIFSLFWHGLALLEINFGKQDTWLHAYDLVDANIYERYIISFYYLATTMITVGYGDFTPKNQIEIAFAIFTMFVTGTIWAFFLTTIGSIIGNIEGKNKMYNQNMQVIHGLMREENVDSTLRLKISNYLQYLYKESNEAVRNLEKDIIQKLSLQLRNDIIQDIQGKYMKDIPIIDKFQEKKKIALLMEEFLYSPGEYIFKQDDADDCSLYFLVKGNVKLQFSSKQVSREDIVLATYEKQSYFGEIAFLTGNKRTLTARAHDFCRVFKIKRSKFLEVIENNDQDLENFQMMKEAITLKDNFKFCNMRCFFCKKGNHLSLSCPRSHLVMSAQGIIFRHIYSLPHSHRKQFNRKVQKFSAYLKRDEVIEGVYQINNEENLYEVLGELEKNFHFVNTQMSFEEQDSIFTIDKDSVRSQHLAKAQQKMKTINKASTKSYGKVQTPLQSQFNLNQEDNSIKFLEDQQARQKPKQQQEESKERNSSNFPTSSSSSSSKSSESSSNLSSSSSSSPKTQQQSSSKVSYPSQSKENKDKMIPPAMNILPKVYFYDKQIKNKKLISETSLEKQHENIPHDIKEADSFTEILTSLEPRHSKVQNSQVHSQIFHGSNNSIKFPSRLNNYEGKFNSFSFIAEQSNQQMEEQYSLKVLSSNRKIKSNSTPSNNISSTPKKVVPLQKENMKYNTISTSKRQANPLELQKSLENFMENLKSINLNLFNEIQQGVRPKTKTIEGQQFQQKMTVVSSKPQKISSENERKRKDTEIKYDYQETKGSKYVETRDEMEYQMLLQFESFKIFKYYLPHFNYPQVIARWQAEYCKRLENFGKKKKFAKRYKNRNGIYYKKYGEESVQLN